jgi:L-asparaginase
MNNSNLRPRLRLLATGGTIAGAQTSGDGRGYTAGAFSIADLVAAVPQIAALAELTVEQVARIGSQDMNEGVWRQLAGRAQAALDDPAIAGVVITHGTDTMEETGYFLNLVLKTAKPVVLVGAMRPATAISADGPMNLYNAVAVAAAPESAGRGGQNQHDAAGHVQVAQPRTRRAHPQRAAALFRADRAPPHRGE